MLNNIKTNQKGFTIVELLIVIVVIAILAAISIVAYNGIQDRGKTSADQSLASQVAKKAEAYNTIKSSYPADVAAFNATGSPAEANLDNTSNITATLPTTAGTVAYKKCTTGAQVVYYNSSDKTKIAIGVGGGANGVVTALCT